MPRVTIILTCYNHMAYLSACVEGVRAQTFTDYDVVAVDDGSSDGTREWLRDTCPVPVKALFNERNLGTYGSLNEALKSATGEFVAVLNDDDLWAPEKLAEQVRMMDENPKVGLVHTDGGFIDGDGAPIEGSPLGFDFPRTATGDVLLALVYANKIIASAAMVRRRCFEELGGFNDAYFGSGDWEMWFRVAEKWDVGFVDKKLTSYRVHGANASHKLERIWRDDQMLREWMLPRLGSLRGRFDAADLDTATAHNWACLGTVRTLNGDPAGGRAAYRESLRIRPGRWQSRARLWATHLPPGLFRRLL